MVSTEYCLIQVPTVQYWVPRCPGQYKNVQYRVPRCPSQYQNVQVPRYLGFVRNPHMLGWWPQPCVSSLQLDVGGPVVIAAAIPDAILLPTDVCFAQEVPEHAYDGLACPNMLYGIQIRAHGWPRNTSHGFALEVGDYCSWTMMPGVVIHIHKPCSEWVVVEMGDNNWLQDVSDVLITN